MVRASCRVFVASSQWREVQRFMPDFPHGKPSHIHHIAECRAQTSGSLCPKACWHLNVDLITQGDMCLHPSTRMTPLFSEQSFCGPESFNEVPIWLINKWHGFYIAVRPSYLAGQKLLTWLRAWRDLCARWATAHGSCEMLSGEWPVFLSSESLLMYVLLVAAMSQGQLWVFIYSCVCSQSLCHCQRVYGLLKSWSLCFYGHCLLKRSAVWRDDRFAFLPDDGWRLSVSSFI